MSFEYIPKGKVEIPDIHIKSDMVLPSNETALLVVDMQNDFVREDGALTVPAAAGTISSIASLIDDARKSGVKVVYTQDTAVEDDPEFDIWPEHCIKDSWGWQIIEEVMPDDNEMVFTKNRYDGFFGTWLDHYLSTLNDIKHLIIVGTVSNICVLHTAASAGLRWYHVVVPANGISALNAFDQALTLRQVDSLYNGDIIRDTRDISFEA